MLGILEEHSLTKTWKIGIFCIIVLLMVLVLIHSWATFRKYSFFAFEASYFSKLVDLCQLHKIAEINPRGDCEWLGLSFNQWG